jgi:hypothetical protein
MAIFKKGAMFGLDARIALVIFGALSVISGAALYSAIQDARVTAILTEMDNVGKATTAYYLDTGIYPPAITGSTGGTTNTLNARELTSSSQSGYQGPYIPFADGTTARMLDHPVYDEVALFGLVDAAFSNAEAAASKCLTTTSGTCSVYVCFSGLANDIQSALDVKVDGVDDNDAGSLRYHNTGFACLKALTFPKTSAVN